MSLETSMSASVQSWLGHELEVRGIDAMIYTRYILSILQQDSIDVDYQDPFHSPKKREPIHAFGKPKSKTKKLDRKSEKRRSVGVDPDQVKKSAAVECLLSVTDQDSDIENLIEELCVKLKQQSSLKRDVTLSPTPTKHEVIAASPGDPKEKYFAAFPPLSDKKQQQSAPGSVWKKNKAKLWSEKVGNKEDGLGNLSDSPRCNTPKTDKSGKDDGDNQKERMREKRCKSATETTKHDPFSSKVEKSTKPGFVNKAKPVAVSRKPVNARKQCNETKNYSVKGQGTMGTESKETKSRHPSTPPPKHARIGRNESSSKPFESERRRMSKPVSSNKTYTWPLHGKQRPSFIVPKFGTSSGNASPLSTCSSKNSSEDESVRKGSPLAQNSHVPKKTMKQATTEKTTSSFVRLKRSVTPELQEDYGWYVKPLDEMFRHSPTPNTIRLYNRGLAVHHEEPYQRNTPEVGLDLVALFEETQDDLVEQNSELPSQSRFLKLFENASKTEVAEPEIATEDLTLGDLAEDSPSKDSSCNWFLSKSESSDENSSEETYTIPALIRTEDVLISPNEEVFWDNESLGYASQEDGIQVESPFPRVDVNKESIFLQNYETESAFRSVKKNESTSLSEGEDPKFELVSKEDVNVEKISSGAQSYTEDYNNNESSDIHSIKETRSSDSFWPLELFTESSIWSPLAVNGISASSYPWGTSGAFSDHHGLFTASNMFSGLNLELSFGESVLRSTHRLLHDGYSDGLCLEMDCMSQSSYPWIDSISSLISPRRAPGQDTFQLWDVNSHRPFNFESNTHSLWFSNGILSLGEDWSSIRTFPDLEYGMINGEQPFIYGGVYGNVPTDSFDNIWSISAVGDEWGTESPYIEDLNLTSPWDKGWLHSTLVSNLEDLESHNSEADLPSEPPVGIFRARSISVDSALSTYATYSGDTGAYSYFGASDDPAHRPLHHVFSESEIFRGSAFRRYRRSSDFYSQLNQQHLKLLTQYRRNVAAAVAATTIAKNVTPPPSGEVEEENLFFSPKTHFRPIQTPRTESLENDSTGNTQATSPAEEPAEVESAADSYGSNYQVYLGDEVSQENQAEFVPKFKIQRDNNKSAQTDTSCSCDNLREKSSESRQFGICHKLGNNLIMTSIEEEGEKLMSHLDKENLDSHLPFSSRIAENQRLVDSPIYDNCSSQTEIGATGDQTRLWSGHIYDIASSLRELWVKDDEIDVLSLCQMHNAETSQENEEGEGMRGIKPSPNNLPESETENLLHNPSAPLLSTNLGASSSNSCRLRGTDFKASAKLETETPAVIHSKLSPYDNLSCDFPEDKSFDHSLDSALPAASVGCSWNPWSTDINRGQQQHTRVHQNSEPVQYLFLVDSTSNLWGDPRENDSENKHKGQPTAQSHCLSESWHPGGEGLGSSISDDKPDVPKIHFGSWQSSIIHDSGKYHWSTDIDSQRQRKDSYGKSVKQTSTKPWKELIQDDEEDDESGDEIAVTARRMNSSSVLKDEHDDVFTDNTADFLLQMFPSEIVDSVPMPSHAQVLYSSDLEEQWRTSGKHFEVQKPRKDKSGPRKKPCSFFLEGHCRRADCKFSHDLTQITCRFWEEGSCFKGLTCPFLHGYQRESGSYESGADTFQLNKEDFPDLHDGKEKSSEKFTNTQEHDTIALTHSIQQGSPSSLQFSPCPDESFDSSSPSSSGDETRDRSPHYAASLPIAIKAKKT